MQRVRYFAKVILGNITEPGLSHVLAHAEGLNEVHVLIMCAEECTPITHA